MKFKQIILGLLGLLIISLFVPFINTTYISPKNPSIMKVLSEDDTSDDTSDKLSRMITYENGFLFVFLILVVVVGFIYANSGEKDRGNKFIGLNIVLLISLLIAVYYFSTWHFILAIHSYVSSSRWSFGLGFYGLFISLLGVYISVLIDFVRKCSRKKTIVLEKANESIGEQTENNTYEEIDRNGEVNKI